MAPPFIKKKKKKSSSGTTGSCTDGALESAGRGVSGSPPASSETDGLLHRQHPPAGSVNQELEVFYVNVTVVDASMAVYDKVRSKLLTKSQKLMPGPPRLREKLAGAVATQAAEKISAKTVAEKMSQKIPRVLMYKLAEKGLKLHAETVFLEKCYFVMQLQVQNANPVLLAESLAAEQKDDDDNDNNDDESVESVVLNDWIREQERESREQATSPYVVTSRLEAKLARDSSSSNTAALSRRSCPARWLAWLLAKCSKKYRDKIESRYLPILIQKQITQKMDDMLRVKMAEKNVLADTEVLPERLQARYFFDHLQQTRKL